jgi:hypothetical protein
MVANMKRIKLDMGDHQQAELGHKLTALSMFTRDVIAEIESCTLPGLSDEWDILDSLQQAADLLADAAEDMSP